MLKFYVGFEIDDFSGQQRTDVDMVDEHYSTVKTLQVIAFQHFDELREFAMSSVSTIDRPEVRTETGNLPRLRLANSHGTHVAHPHVAVQSFLEHVSELSDDRLRELCQQLNLVPSADLEAKEPLNPGVRVTSTAFLSRETLLAILADRYQRRFSQLDSINEMPLFPTEQMLWDENIVPTQLYVDGSLALPKLHLQVSSTGPL
jgi:intron-binding protein aquarius